MSRDEWRGEERDFGARVERRLRLRGLGLAALMRVWGATWRVDEDRAPLEAARAMSPSGAVIYALWHNRMLMLAYTHRGRGIHVLRSSSRDGRLIAEVLWRFGFGAVPGSSSRGGAAGLRRLVTLTRAGEETGITVDGPRGPRGHLQPGILQLSALSGCPILPLAASAGRARLFGSWDRTVLPLPFQRVAIRYGEPMLVPRGEDEAALAERRLALEGSLRGLSDALDEATGLGAIPPAPLARTGDDGAPAAGRDA